MIGPINHGFETTEYRHLTTNCHVSLPVLASVGRIKISEVTATESLAKLKQGSPRMSLAKLASLIETKT